MIQVLPLAPRWADVVDHLVAECGSLAELARLLQQAAPPSLRLSDDPQTVERGLRRLRARGQAAGDKYGRLLLRVMGVPLPLRRWARALGQYHSRLSDLSVDVRLDQLRQWDRPPISETSSSLWIQIGLASTAHRLRQPELVRRRLKLAATQLSRAGAMARMELLLFEARLAKNATSLLQEAEAVLPSIRDADEQLCYLARLQDQRAYRAARRRSEGLARAVELMEGLPDEGPPFVVFRRNHTLAWCVWKTGDVKEADWLAQRAATAAGDGGLLRFRCMALMLLGHIRRDPGLFERAEAIAVSLGDEDLAEKAAVV
ncbi:MAG: hypothetical protein KTR31_19315 [Myxococcales bacterium]|nr:hypothetical protein [Myxococcales bacterium]